MDFPELTGVKQVSDILNWILNKYLWNGRPLLGVLWLEQFIGTIQLQITRISCLVRTCQTSFILRILHYFVVYQHYEVFGQFLVHFLDWIQ